MNNNHQKKILIQQLKQQYLSVGILAANWLNFAEQLAILDKKQINILHFDIADGHFSPLFTVGSIAIKQFGSQFFKDVHLMVEKQLEVAKSCVKEGANLVTLQIEQQSDLTETIEWLNSQENTFLDQKQPILTGLSICPETDLKQLVPFLDRIDVIQLLTLDPRTGKKYPADYMVKRLSELTLLVGKIREDKLINVDGSMSLELATELAKTKNIDWFVSGSALFSERLDVSLSKWENPLRKTAI